MTTRFDEAAAAIGACVEGFRATGDPRILFAGRVMADVDGLIDAAAALDPDHPAPEERARMDRARALLGTLFLLRFGQAPGDLTDFAHLLAFHWPDDDRPAEVPAGPLRVLLPGPEADVTVQFGAAVALFKHAEAGGDPAVLRVAVHLFDAVAAGTPPPHREFPLRVACVVAASLAIHRTTGDLAAAGRAIEVADRFLTGLSPKHPARPWFLAAAGVARVARLRHGGLADLADAIGIGELALTRRERPLRSRTGKRRRPGDPFLRMLADLAATYELHPLRARLEAELAFAYDVRAGLARVPAVDPAAGTAADHLTRFDRTGDLDDLRRAVAVAGAAPGEPDLAPAGALVAVAAHVPGDRYLAASIPWPGSGGFLKRLWLDRFAPLVTTDADADEAVVDAVIDLGEYALGTRAGQDEPAGGVPDADDPATGRTLIGLGDVRAYRYSRFGGKPDIDRAVALVELAGSPDGAREMGMVAFVYMQRFTVSRSAADLGTAVSWYEQALRTTSRDAAERQWLMHQLADAYRATAKVAPDRTAEFLRRGAELSEQVLAGAPAGDPRRALWLAAAGDTHNQRYGDSRDPADLDRAIGCYRQAVAVTDDPLPASKLGAACHARFHLAGDPADLRLAIEGYAEALAWPAPDDGLRSMALAGYCTAYRDLFDVATDEVSPGYLETLAEVCVARGRGNPMPEVVACHAVGSLAMAMNRPGTAVPVLDHAVGLLRSATWRETGWADQETHLRGTVDLASTAIAAHLANADPAGAVEAAERGRALILGSELDTRADLAHLATAEPALAGRLRDVRDRLNAPMVFDHAGAVHDTVGRSGRTRLWAEHDRIVEQVRRLPGFAGFLRPPSLPELRRAAAGGAVVLVNADAHRSDAVIVTGDADPVPVPLPRLTFEDVRTHAEAIADATSAPSLVRALRARRVLPDLLAWLWESAVEPVVAALPGGHREPRVWWLPTGPLGRFPLHAAGAPGRPGALDLVVSSYIPTLRALQHARRRARPAVRRQLTVALADEPGLPRLPR
ncbi:hypothetical protein, partial [Amycolatopsis vancoresmycina]